MFKKTFLTTALSATLSTTLSTTFVAAFALPISASAADDKELSEIRAQMKFMKESYEARMQALEKRLEQAEAKVVQTLPAPTLVELPPTTAPTPTRAAVSSANAFNPAIALILNGTMANLSQDPEQYRLQGFIPSGGEIGPGARSFSLGESELTLSANIDTNFAGQLTFSLAHDNTVSVEESFFQTKALLDGSNFKVGRFLSSVGYLNSQHAHTWDFVDAPLAYQAFFGGQYKPDGVQLKWLAPIDAYLEIGTELGNGASFPGNDRNKNGFGASTLFAHMGDDIGQNASWRAGVSYLNTSAKNRSFSDLNTEGDSVANTFSGASTTWIADAIFKWSPNGNSTQRNFKLQGEYFRRNESGVLAFDAQAPSSASNNLTTVQSGWYVQSVYQFMPQWRVGLRYDKLTSGSPRFGQINGVALSASDFPALLPFNPKRSSIMFDYSLSEFSRLRLQFARDNARPGASDNQIFLQYNMSLGAHGAHTF